MFMNWTEDENVSPFQRVIEHAALTGKGAFKPTGDPTSDTIRELFIWTTKPEAYQFHSHPATLMVVNYMQRCLGMSNNWKDRPISSTLFPDLDPNGSPAVLDLDVTVSVGIFVPADKADVVRQVFTRGAQALLVKSFYNIAPHTQENTNIDSAIANIAELNRLHDAWATPLLIAYIRHAASLAPSVAGTELYMSLLTSPEWRNLRAAQIASGDWKMATHEMHFHFVKLAACGASDEQIAKVYNDITTTPPILNPSTFSTITPNTWRQFSGWRSGGLLEPADLQAQNMTDSKEGWAIFEDRSEEVIITVSETFISDAGYYRRPESSSCVRGSAMVVLGNGVDVKPISEVSAGEQILTSTLGLGDHQAVTKARRVAFVSIVPRGQRALFALHGIDVWFTDTHPIVRTTEGLSFVQPDLAASLNPSWHSLLSIAVPTTELRVDSVKYSDGTHPEFLYDLVFEHDDNNPGCGPVTYFLRGLADSRTLQVASEAPVADWFPYATIFLQSAIGSVIEGGAFGSAQQSLEASVRNTSKRLRELLCRVRQGLREKDAFAIIRHGIHRSPTSVSSITSNACTCSAAPLATLLPLTLDVGETSEETLAFKSAQKQNSRDATDPQAAGAFIEQLVATLGRPLADELSVGWAYLDPLLPGTSTGEALSPSSDFVPAFMLHTARFLTKVPFPTGTMSIQIRLSTDGGNKFGPSSNAAVIGQGTHLLQVQHTMELSALPQRVTTDVDNGTNENIEVSPDVTSIAAHVEFTDGDLILASYIGRGQFVPDTPSILLLGRSEVRPSNAFRHIEADVLILSCKYDTIPRSSLIRQPVWNANIGGCQEAYAREMGIAFGAALL